MDRQDRIEEFRFATGYGTVVRVYPDVWECDLLGANGGLVRAQVLGGRLPEVSVLERPQWALYGYGFAKQSQPWCLPISRSTIAPEDPRGNFAYYEKVLNHRITISHTNVFEVRNRKGEQACTIRIEEHDGVVRLDTPHCRVVLKESDKSVTIEGEPVTVHCKNATVMASQDITVTASGKVDVRASGKATIQASQLEVTAPTTITGNLQVTGDIIATGSILDTVANTPHHSHG